MILWRDRDLAYASADGAGGIAHGCADQFRKSDDRHRRWSPGMRIRSSIAKSSAEEPAARQKFGADRGARRPCANLDGLMRSFRVRLARVVLACLVWQLALALSAPALVAFGLDQDPCCQGLGPGQSCPMHRSVPGDRTCRMRSDCPRTDLALMSIFAGSGILPQVARLVFRDHVEFLPADRDALAVNRTNIPDAPPPRA